MLALVVSAWAASAAAAAALAAPTAQVRPPRAKPGEVVAIDVRGAAVVPTGELAGRPLHFFATPGGFRAYAGLPVETPLGPLAARLLAGERAVEAPFTVVEPGWREKRLTVPPQFTDAKPPEIEARLQEDRAAFGEAFAQPPSPPLFTKPFAWPRSAKRLTGRFGDLRTFNGATQGQHYGTDLSGPVGAPVLAANDGRVVLVRDAWASGNTVVLFHGAGLYTVYFHLQSARVREGEAVRRGARIGALGATGRASGPHLHWGAKVGDLYVDPESLLRLTARTAKRPSPAR